MSDLSGMRQRLFERARKQGYLTFPEARRFYRHRSSTSRALTDLVENGYLIVKDAPPISDKEKIWFPSKA